MIWKQSWESTVPRSLRAIILDKRYHSRRNIGRDFAQYTANLQKRNRLISQQPWDSSSIYSSCIPLLDEPLRKRRRDHDSSAQNTGKPHVLSTSVVDLFDFFKCFPGLKWTIGSRLLRYYNPTKAPLLPRAGKKLRTRNESMMTLLSPSGAAATLLQLRQDMESMKLSYDKNRRARISDGDTDMLNLDGEDNYMEVECMQEC